MIKFIIGLIGVIAVVVVAYYYVTVKQPKEAVDTYVEAALDAEVTTKKIPAGSFMEDGTIPE